MADISKNSFDGTKRHRRVVFQRSRPVFDFEFNEAQDIAAHERDQLGRQMADGRNLLGAGGRVTPATSGNARQVDVAAGMAVHLDSLVRLPAVTNLPVFADATVSGVQSSCLYVQWRDVEVLATADTSLRGTINAVDYEGAARTKREVQVSVAMGVLLPPVVAGWNVFSLAVVTHDFTNNGAVIRASDVAQAYGLTPGELGGGVARTTRFFSGAPVADAGYELDTVNALTGNIFLLRRAGAARLALHETNGLSWRGGSDIPDSGKVARNDLSNVFLASQGVRRAASTDAAWSAHVAGDTQDRWLATAGGRQEWGLGGTTPRDTFLYRSAAGRLKTDGELEVGALRAGSTPAEVIDVNRVLKNVSMAATLLTGTLDDGRLSANVPLKNAVNAFSNAQEVNRAALTDWALLLRRTSDTQYPYALRLDGHQEWGGGAGSARDTNMYRKGVGILGTDHAFDATGGFRVGGTEVLTSARVLQGVSMAATLLTGTLDDGRLSTNVPRKNGSNEFTAGQRVKVDAGASPSYNTAQFEINSSGANPAVLGFHRPGHTGAVIRHDSFDAGLAVLDENNVLTTVRMGTLKAAAILWNGSNLNTYLNQGVLSTSSPTFADLLATGATGITASNGWFRTQSNRGLYNDTYTQYLYAEDANFWALAPNGTGVGGLRFRGAHAGALKGSLAWDATGFGLLDSAGGWRVRTVAGTGGELSGSWSTTGEHAVGTVLRMSSFGGGIVGAYDHTKVRLIYAMGESYRSPLDGSSATGLYGLAMGYRDGTGATGNAAFRAGLGHQVGFFAGGAQISALGDSGIWTSGTIWANVFLENSSRELKKDIAVWDGDSGALLDRLAIVQFRYKTETSDALPHIGVIAEDAQVASGGWLTGGTGKAWDTTSTLAVVVRELQQARRRIAHLEALAGV